jgi:hypothetical protein
MFNTDKLNKLKELKHLGKIAKHLRDIRFELRSVRDFLEAEADRAEGNFVRADANGYDNSYKFNTEQGKAFTEKIKEELEIGDDEGIVGVTPRTVYTVDEAERRGFDSDEQ